MRARSGFLLLMLVALAPLGRAQDAATYALTAPAAEKFVRATQQLVSSGAAPNVQGGINPANLANLKAALDGNPAAQQALSGVNITSGEYVAFMGAAMSAMMVGQMETAGMRGTLPPGITTRPSQPNIDFMKGNVDLFQRAMHPGASAAVNAGAAATAARARTSDEALPMPAEAGAVLPSSILARLPRLDSIKRGMDCSLGGVHATIEAETRKALALQDAYYGNPGDSGLKRTAAEGAILDRLDDSDLDSCGMELAMGAGFSDEFRAADAARQEASSRITQEQMDAWNKCPGIPGGKEAACERQVNAEAARKMDAAQRAFLAAMSQPFANRVATLRTCTVKREAIVADAKTANVRGANVKLALRPLVVAWQQLMLLPNEWIGMCESAQNNLLQ